MAVLKIEVPVSKEAYELAQAVMKLILAGKKHLLDGADIGDIPDLLAVLMSDEVLVAIKGLDGLDDELKENPEAFINAFATLGSALVKEFTKA